MTGNGLAETFQSIALSGSLLLAISVAVIASLVAFPSPCVLPIVPGYLGYVSGLAGQGPPTTKTNREDPGNAGNARRLTSPFRTGTGRMLSCSLLFIAGFTLVFMALGCFAGAMGYVLQAHAVWINRIAGAIVIFMGLIFMGAFPRLTGNVQVSKKRPDAGLVGPHRWASPSV